MGAKSILNLLVLMVNASVYSRVSERPHFSTVARFNEYHIATYTAYHLNSKSQSHRYPICILRPPVDMRYRPTRGNTRDPFLHAFLGYHYIP